MSKRNHAHYYKGDLPLEGKYEVFYRKIFESSLLIHKAFSKILKIYNDFDLISANEEIYTNRNSINDKQKFGNNFILTKFLDKAMALF